MLQQVVCRSRRPRGLGHKSAAARLPGLRVQISPRALMFLFCKCCMLSGRGLCDADPSSKSFLPSVCVCVCVCVGVSVCDLETSTMRQPRPEWGCWATGKIRRCSSQARSQVLTFTRVFLHSGVVWCRVWQLWWMILSEYVLGGTEHVVHRLS